MTKKVKKDVQVILKQKLEKGGQVGNILTVRTGYARNFLIPQQIAQLATPTAMKEFLVKEKEIKKQEEKLIQNCLLQKSLLEQIGQFEIQKRIGEEKKIFGKVTKKQILDVFEEKTGKSFDTAQIELPEIKELGVYDVAVRFHSTVSTQVKIKILSQ